MSRLTRRAAVLLGLLLSGSVFLVSRAAWLEARVPDLAGGSSGVDVTGGQAAPLVVAAAIVGLASAGVTAISSRAVRFVSGPLLLASGIAAIASAAAVRADPSAHASSAISQATGVAGTASSLTVTPWSLVAMLPSALQALLGIAVLIAGRRWSRARRFERDATQGGPAESTRDTAPSATRAAAPVPAGSGTQESSVLWDALSRGEDPTALDRRDDEGVADR